ncbi:MAG TPA: hypothetical protein VMT58_09765 [Candidatus Binataceae bacterium]|nr:hypothetical protein [Candidatus Binataceae bacterium]
MRSQVVLCCSYIATLLDGNQYIPAGQVTWTGSPDPHIGTVLKANQICADPGFIRARTVKARITIQDVNHFTEELVNPNECIGFPVKFTRMTRRPQSGAGGN